MDNETIFACIIFIVSILSGVLAHILFTLRDMKNCILDCCRVTYETKIMVHDEVIKNSICDCELCKDIKAYHE